MKEPLKYYLSKSLCNSLLNCSHGEITLKSVKQGTLTDMKMNGIGIFSLLTFK